MTNKLYVMEYLVIREGMEPRDSHVRIELRKHAPDIQWAVTSFGDCLNKKTLQWDPEPRPSGRTKAWTKDRRFSTVEEALACFEKWEEKYKNETA